MIETIPNRHPDRPIVCALTTPYSGACPVTGEPQAGSTITVRYAPAGRLIGLRAVAAWLEVQRDDAIDLETIVQRLAVAATQAVGVVVEVHGSFVLQGGITLCVSSSAPEKTNE